jgi:hypothetical protein
MGHEAAAKRHGIGKRIGAMVELALSTVVCWAFGLTTCAVLLYIASGLWLYQLMTATPLSILDAGSSQKLWGLTYTGRPGAFMAIGQAAAVLLALGMSLGNVPRIRRLGLLAVLFWAGLWAAHGVYMVATAWGGLLSDLRLVAVAGGLLLIFGCAVHRTLCAWRVRAGV